MDLFESSTAQLTLRSAQKVKLTQESRYPDEGAVKLRVEPPAEGEFAIKLRIPEHVGGVQVRVNGEPQTVAGTPGDYLALRRTWRAGDTVELTFSLETWLSKMADGSAAIMRGTEALALDARDNSADLEKVRLIEPLTLAPAERSPDGRPRYQLTLEVAGQPAPVLLTPFAVAGNATVVATQFLVPYRTAFPTAASSPPK